MVLELMETIHVTSGEVPDHSRDLFGPGGVNLHVVRALDVERPDAGQPGGRERPGAAHAAQIGGRRGGTLTPGAGGHILAPSGKEPGMKALAEIVRTPPLRSRRWGRPGGSTL